MMNAAFAVGNIIGPQTFRAADAPYYQPAKISLVACWAASGVLAVFLFAYFSYCNAQRNKRHVARDENEVSETKAFAGLTDKQNQEFRYFY